MFKKKKTSFKSLTQHLMEGIKDFTVQLKKWGQSSRTVCVTGQTILKIKTWLTVRNFFEWVRNQARLPSAYDFYFPPSTIPTTMPLFFPTSLFQSQNSSFLAVSPPQKSCLGTETRISHFLCTEHIFAFEDTALISWNFRKAGCKSQHIRLTLSVLYLHPGPQTAPHKAEWCTHTWGAVQLLLCWAEQSGEDSYSLLPHHLLFLHSKLTAACCLPAALNKWFTINHRCSVLWS